MLRLCGSALRLLRFAQHDTPLDAHMILPLDLHC